MSRLRLDARFWRIMKIRIIKDYMDIVILSRLRSVPSSGYDIVVHIHQENNLHISSGAIYSTLYSLERKGLVRGRSTVNKRIYNITQEGLNYVENVSNNREKILSLMNEILG